MRLIACVLVLLGLCATGCGSSNASSTASQTTVVSTAFPLFEAAVAVGGSRVHATNLLPLDPFATTLTDSQITQLRDAKIAIVLGKGTQPAVDQVVAQRSGPTLQVLDFIDTKPAINSAGVDPYVWLNPINMGKITELVADQLTKSDPSSGAYYAKNEKNFGYVIAGVDQNFAKTFATCATKVFVTEDPDFQYLADRFGLDQVNADGNGSNTLSSAIDTYHPTTVFRTTLPSLDEARQLQQTYGVKVAVLDTVATQTDQARRAGSTYAGVMYLNLDAMRTGMSCSAEALPGK